jgi:hypothetical protein
MKEIHSWEFLHLLSTVIVVFTQGTDLMLPVLNLFLSTLVPPTYPLSLVCLAVLDKTQGLLHARFLGSVIKYLLS